MAYAYRYLSADEQADIAQEVTAEQAAPTVDEPLLRAWEADLAAHQALLGMAGDDEAKALHTEAIKTLVQALTATPTSR